jgi:hypothetical protein
MSGVISRQYVKVCAFIYKLNKLFIVAVKDNNSISLSADRASRYACLINTNKMHFSFLIHSNNLSCTNLE